MGNSVAKVSHCCAAAGDISNRHDIAVYVGDHLHKGLGHSFCYIQSDPARLSNSKIHSEETTTFFSISGASVSANTSTSLSDACLYSSSLDEASSFESSDSFASVPLQPVPRGQLQSGSAMLVPGSSPIERGFLSGPIERGFLSGPIERGFVSAPIDRGLYSVKTKKQSLIKTLKRAISNTISRGKKSIMAPIKGVKESVSAGTGENLSGSSANFSAQASSNNDVDDDSLFFNGKPESAMGARESRDEDFDLNHYLKRTQGKNSRHRSKGVAKRWEESQRRWRCEWDRERMELDRKLKEKLNCKGSNSNGVNHFDVLNALSQALKKTEESFFEIADKMAAEKPELSLMGSCVLVMLMKGEDVYLMNVGDSRAVLAQKCETDLGIGKVNQDLEIINEESMRDLEVFDGDELYRLSSLSYLQLTRDHSTYVHKEVQRIKKEHPDDPCAVMNERVKGYLKVTRAFGVGFLKQPKWNDLLLEMFQIDYIGNSPYITCHPSLYHHKLSSRDRFLILSSDGLYQYFTNEEAVSEVELFISAFPEGDPAQHLIEEVLFRAAKRAGIDFHELLAIPQGDRRRYHDDVSVIIISLEGRIWRSSL
ncbi:hypothetical protein GH714_014085 [Hevea brasiliensis]|uniref:PPM-type phosphatase domain-containing protein n=1 Tax=Hevea brasiliensis TaxID=3981 RepID=A0A6A6LSA7_HEVBR|nr:hypothetical protein GH714_014085 [Hevea brasiliensis]